MTYFRNRKVRTHKECSIEVRKVSIFIFFGKCAVRRENKKAPEGAFFDHDRLLAWFRLEVVLNANSKAAGIFAGNHIATAAEALFGQVIIVDAGVGSV